MTNSSMINCSAAHHLERARVSAAASYTHRAPLVRPPRRLFSAVGDGTLSAPFRALPPAHGRAVAALLELPDEVGWSYLRTLAPRIGQLRRRHQLNLLGSEALAAAVHLKADVSLGVLLHGEDALRAEGRTVRGDGG